jgi:hypothetical protein
LSEASGKAARPRDFIPVTDAVEARKFLKEGAKTLASCMIWTKDQKHVINTHLSGLSDADLALFVWIPTDFDPKALVDTLAADGSSECFFSVSLQRANVFFKTPLLGYDEQGFKFRVPEQLYKVQRRKDLRFPIPEGYVLKVEFQDPLFPETRLVKKVLDISASGMAIWIADSEEAMFHPGMIIHKVSFTVRSKRITCDAEVRHIKLMALESKTPGVKMGVLFRNLKQVDAQVIATYVFEESRKFFSKFI